MPKDYYIVLGVSRGADLNKIKKAYRTVVKKYHPDVAQSEESKQRFLEIKEAYETLSDERRRKEYDQELTKQGSELRITRVPSIIESRTSFFDQIERLFSSSADDFFEGFLPGFFDVEKGRISGKDLYFEAILSPGEAAEGVFPLSPFLLLNPVQSAEKGELGRISSVQFAQVMEGFNPKESFP